MPSVMRSTISGSWRAYSPTPFSEIDTTRRSCSGDSFRGREAIAAVCNRWRRHRRLRGPDGISVAVDALAKKRERRGNRPPRGDRVSRRFGGSLRGMNPRDGDRGAATKDRFTSGGVRSRREPRPPKVRISLGCVCECVVATGVTLRRTALPNRGSVPLPERRARWDGRVG